MSAVCQTATHQMTLTLSQQGVRLECMQIVNNFEDSKLHHNLQVLACILQKS